MIPYIILDFHTTMYIEYGFDCFLYSTQHPVRWAGIKKCTFFVFQNDTNVVLYLINFFSFIFYNVTYKSNSINEQGDERVGEAKENNFGSLPRFLMPKHQLIFVASVSPQKLAHGSIPTCADFLLKFTAQNTRASLIINNHNKTFEHIFINDTHCAMYVRTITQFPICTRSSVVKKLKYDCKLTRIEGPRGFIISVRLLTSRK